LKDRERETLGAFLKRERELRNLSLEDLARMTKVKRHFLLAIEENRYDALPSPIYVKGFLSAYAKSVGTEPEKVLIRYEQTMKGEFKEEPLIRIPLRREKDFIRQVFFKRRQSWIVFGVVAVGLFISFYFHPFLSGPSWERVSNKQDSPKTLDPLFIKETEMIPLPAKGESILIELKAIEKTWVQIHTDGHFKEEVLFQPGEGKSYQGTHKIEMWIGNAGGLEIIFDRERLEGFGRSGEVVRLVFTRDGVKKKER